MDVRFFAPVQDEAHDIYGWSREARYALDHLLLLGVNVRLIAETGVNASDWPDTHPWIPYLGLLGKSISETDFLNVVCGFGHAFEVYWTANVPNVAITGPHPRLPNGSELAALRNYDYISVPIALDTPEFGALFPLYTRTDPADGMVLYMRPRLES